MDFDDLKERHSGLGKVAFFVNNAYFAKIDMLEELSYQIEGHTIFALDDAAAWPVHVFIRSFSHEIEERIDSYKADHPELEESK